MTLTTFDPFTLVRDLDRLFESAGTGTRDLPWAPRLDVFERDGAFVVRTEIAGTDPADLDVSLDGGILTVSGHRQLAATLPEGAESGEITWHRREILEGDFRRSVALPDGLDLDSVAAASNHGILEVTIQKTPEVLPRKIDVAVTS